MPDELSHVDKFKEAARQLGVDDEGFTEAVRRVAALKSKRDAASEEAK